MESYICGGWWRWKFRNVLPVALLLMSLQRQGTSVPVYTSQTTSCASPGLGCPVLSATTSSATTTSMPLTTSSSTVQTTTTTTTPAATTNVPTLPSTTTVTQTIIPSAAAATNTTLFYSTTNALTASATTIVSNPATTNLPTTNNTVHVTTTPPLSPTTNTPANITTTPVSEATTPPPSSTNMSPTVMSTNIIKLEGLFYRISFVVNDKEAKLTESDVEKTVAQWLNQTFQNWTHVVYVDNFRIQPNSDSQLKRSASKKFTCQALLVYQTSTNVTLEEVAISTRMVGSSPNIGNGLELETVNVQSVENCPEETPLHYIWPESRPTVTQYVPCFPNKDQTASRTCVISPLNYTAFWGAPDISNCTDIDSINVSAENAAEVADQLADITNNELSTDEVFKVVGKVKELVNVAKINTTLATTVLNIISNVMTSSVSALAVASERTLKTVDELVQKLEFDGPSVSITSKNLALGISTLNHGKFNGTSFSAFIQPNTTDLQIDFESNQLNPLAQVTLPATLLKNLTDAETAAISRINFMFFSKIGLFQDKQDGMSLNSYVVASSVGNYSISNLQDPVEIEIVHLNYQPKPKPTCMFWDFTMKNDSGGWNSKGCRVSPMSNGNKTICLCDHLTHFGILMDISGSAAQIDEKNTKILTFITYIGCGISAIFSAVTLLTYIAFEKLRRDYPSKILMNLSTSLLFLNMVFLLDGWLASFEMEGLCVAVAVFLHFFLLTSFTWMGLESIHMYIALVKVFNTYIRRYILKFCIVGWGLPAAIVATVVAIDKNSYGKMEYGKGDTGQGSSEFCWIRSHVVFYVTCVGYFSVIFLLNVAMFIVVMIQICGRNGKRSNRTLREEVLRNLRSVISLTFLLGMTWGFAFFAWGPVNLAFMYLFSISNSLQGLFIFIFHCALKENVQKQWRRYLCCGRFRLADNSDWSKTATNNTKKVSSDTVGKSLSSSSFGSSTANWTSKAKATLNPFAKRNSNAGKGYSNQTNPKSVSLDGEASSSSSSIIPVHQVIDKVKGYCSARSDNFYKNIIMSDSFSHSTKF
ncbi:adhesion G-protein coupled receptor G6-like isoform X24 [Oncorhynchus keta]|uniref:adhesion G-protein coupled receptor G6-like isoform X24 n=1 Tax=Oncorhynchus keta TaxID=8018 RepID=UPI00227C9D5A|nr:adhesion G-protein coupled receptor G6-like isoform X24 [Oncorhynchus keta]